MAEYIAFGKKSINTAAITDAEWKDGTLEIHTAAGHGLSLPFADPDCEKAAKAVGLGDYYDEWAATAKAEVKARTLAQAQVDAKAAAEAEIARKHEEEVAKAKAKILADAEAAAEKAEKAEHKAAHPHAAHK
jgi:hypothetical protein